MANEAPDSGPITLINVFEIRPDDVEQFLQQWRERAEFLGRQPGFRSLRLHRALHPDSRFQLVNVAEWDSARRYKRRRRRISSSRARSIPCTSWPLPPTLLSIASSSKPPRGSPMPKPYRVGLFVRANNAVMRSLISAGVRIGTFAVLTVPGRRTGRPVSVPLVVFPYAGHDHLVASYGVVNWVRNLRAANGRADLRRGHATEKITAVELTAEQAGPILRFSLRAGPPGIPRPIVRIFRRYFVLPYLDVDMHSSDDDFVRAARNHPVFRLQRVKQS
jgi:hypothetical protein